jgi:hypothetical protein
MTLSSILPAHDADTIKLRGDLFIAQLAYDFRTSQSAIIAALRPCITPPQPETSSSRAPAAQTDGGGSPPCSSPSVEPDADACPDDPDGVHFTGCGCDYDSPDDPTTEAPKPLPDVPDIPADALVQPAEAKTSVQADGDVISAVKGSARLENAEGVESPPSAPATRRRIQGRKEELLRVHAKHPDWPDYLIAEEMGVDGAYVRKAAQRLGIKLTSRRDYVSSQKARTTEALKAPLDKPVTAATPTSQGDAAPPTEEPPAILPSLPALRSLPLPPPAVKQMRSEPTGRFYLRDKTTLLYVHQSLSPAPTSAGPLMTEDRKRAWYDNIQRFRGAAKKWPQIKAMRKESAHVA